MKIVIGVGLLLLVELALLITEPTVIKVVATVFVAGVFGVVVAGEAIRR